jgi:transposase InsO family protein
MVPTELHELDPDLPLVVSTDASITGCGATLWQERADGTRSIVALFSKAFNRPQRNYPNWKRELLGVKLALEAFDHYVYGRPVTVQTDCKSLLTYWSEKQTRTTVRWYMALAKYDTTWMHVEGISNVIPDALSRLFEHSQKRDMQGLNEVLVACVTTRGNPPDQHESKEVHTAVERAREEVKAADEVGGQDDLSTSQDPGPSTGLNQSHVSGRRLNADAGAMDIESDRDEARRGETTESLSHGGMSAQPVTFSETSKTAIVRQVHLRLGPHAGVRAVIRKLTELGISWPSMPDDVQLVVSGCITCAQRRPIRYAHGPYTAQLASKVWEKTHVDLGELPKDSNGNKFFLVVVDRHSNYIVAAALKNKEAVTVRMSLSTIFSALGVPMNLKSDNGMEFLDAATQAWLKDLDVRATRSLAYHKEGNGAAENGVKRVKRALDLLAAAVDGSSAWSDRLLAATTCLNNTPSQASKLTPFEVLQTRKQMVVAAWEENLVAQFREQLTSKLSSDSGRTQSAVHTHRSRVQSLADRQAVQLLNERWQLLAQERRASTLARYKDKVRARAQRGLADVSEFKVGQFVMYVQPNLDQSTANWKGPAKITRISGNTLFLSGVPSPRHFSHCYRIIPSAADLAFLDDNPTPSGSAVSSMLAPPSSSSSSFEQASTLPVASPRWSSSASASRSRARAQRRQRFRQLQPQAGTAAVAPVTDVELANLATRRPRRGRAAASFYGHNNRSNSEGVDELLLQLAAIPSPEESTPLSKGELVDLWNNLGRRYRDWNLHNTGLSSKLHYHTALYQLSQRVQTLRSK